jgi:hypothetical protein
MERFLLSQQGDGSMYTYVREVSPKAKNLYGWIDLITEKCLPFSTVGDKVFRKYLSLDPICVRTLKKYMKLLYR